MIQQHVFETTVLDEMGLTHGHSADVETDSWAIRACHVEAKLVCHLDGSVLSLEAALEPPESHKLCVNQSFILGSKS